MGVDAVIRDLGRGDPDSLLAAYRERVPAKQGFVVKK